MKNCIACNTIGKNNPAHYKELVYGTNNASTSIRLCYPHSVELFKTGQTNFKSKYRADEMDVYENKQNRNPLANYFNFNSFK